MNITIDNMQRCHLDQVLVIEKESFTSPWSRTAFEMEIGGENRFAHYLVAKDGDEIIGYIGAWFILNEAHITNVAVKPTYRRQGVGEILMNYFFAQAVLRKIDAVTLEVRVTNYSAQNLYRKLGFREMGIRPKYYQDNNEDAIIMWKVLDDGEN